MPPLKDTTRDILVKFASDDGFDPNDFAIQVSSFTDHIDYEIQIDYIPKDFHRRFKLRPYYESGSLSNYMINRQIEDQVLIFMNEIKDWKEGPYDTDAQS